MKKMILLAAFAASLARAEYASDVQEFCSPFVDGQVHASTVLPLKGQGEYLVCWFQGTKEGEPDVAIWGSRRIGGTWEKTRQIAKVRDAAHWNPVLFRGRDGRIVLFFKVGKPIGDWQTYVTESRDEGQTWSAPKELVLGDVSGGRGPVKNKCLRLKSGRLLAPASRERGPWRAFVDISDDDGRTWRAAPEMRVPDLKLKTGKPFGVIQPTLWQSADGRVHAFLRSNAGRIFRSDSSDDGETWSEVADTGLPNNNSGIDLVRASDGRLYMAMNVSDVDWGPRTRLDLRVSADDGATWKPFRTLISRVPGRGAWDGDEYSYPAIIEPRPGIVAITYTFNRKTIRFVEIETRDDTDFIQSLLDKGGEVDLPEREYVISRKLMFKSDTSLKLAKGARIRLALGSDCAMAGNADIVRGNENITVDGGVWDMVNVVQSPNPMLNAYANPPLPPDNRPGYVADRFLGNAFFFVNVKNFRFRNLTVRNPVTYACQLARVNDFEVENIVFDYTTENPAKGNMDGIHLDGGCHHGVIRNVRGTCWDDTVALNANDGACAIHQGPITDIEIDGIYAEYGHSAVRLLSAGEPVERVRIKNVNGSFFCYGIGFTHYFPERRTVGVFRDIDISHVRMYKAEPPMDPPLPMPYQRRVPLFFYDENVHLENVKVSDFEIVPRLPSVGKKLPPGSILAEGWLRRQLELQRDGLTGHAEELYDDIGLSDWLTGRNRGGQHVWERGPYYARGLLSLAFALDDERLKAKAKRWVDAILASQRPNGDFGPKNDNWWANMLALQIVRDWYMTSLDRRVLPFLRRYFDYQAKRLPEYPLVADSPWAVARAGDEIEVVMWLHDNQPSDRLVSLMKLLFKQGADWTAYYRTGDEGGLLDADGYQSHIVNFMQGLKTPALRFRLLGEKADAEAYSSVFDPKSWAMQAFGRPDRMLNGSEPLSPLDGTELCAITERILSCREVVAATGNADAMDDMETVAYNALPSTLSADGKGIRYYNRLNQTQCTMDEKLGYECNPTGDSVCPGPDSGYPCCRSNFHAALPKFVESMWMEIMWGGYMACAYGDCLLRTPEMTIRESGSYPRGNKVKFEFLDVIHGDLWPIVLRKPRGCRSVAARLNGKPVKWPNDGCFKGPWHKGDVIELEFDMPVREWTGPRGEKSYLRGPLLYSLPIQATEIPHPGKGIRKNFPKVELKPRSECDFAVKGDARVIGDGVIEVGDCRLVPVADTQLRRSVHSLY
ncbi:MAG: exo-alpha-sialidase [Kiritimatiellae bacterium]|nr:exo-alpha-sialidase [Kiritimatiellia bacterium]